MQAQRQCEHYCPTQKEEDGEGEQECTRHGSQDRVPDHQQAQERIIRRVPAVSSWGCLSADPDSPPAGAKPFWVEIPEQNTTKANDISVSPPDYKLVRICPRLSSELCLPEFLSILYSFLAA